jgi:ribosomal protein S18 acetylase RimI-like enzyme
MLWAVTVVITYLEMRDPAALRPAGPPRIPAELRTVADPAVNRHCYETIGADWAWVDRLGWTEERWAAYAEGVETLLAVTAGQPAAGYAEMRAEPGREVQLAMFGLQRDLHGQGLGGWLLTEATRRAWEMHPGGTRRVWLHTCTLDGPHALANYEARGFEAYRRVEAR